MRSVFSIVTVMVLGVTMLMGVAVVVPSAIAGAQAASKPSTAATQLKSSTNPLDIGYWEVAADGGLFAFGDAGFFGSMGGRPLNKPIVGMAATSNGAGYWEVASDGGLFSFGNATFYGSMGGKPLNEPVVGMAATPAGAGYWEVASDGGLFAFGDAGFYGSMGGKPLNEPIVGMTATSDGGGYWEVASDGGLFAFGDAGFFGSMGGQQLDKPIVGMDATPDGGGYWEVASDGGLFAFGDATFYGSMGGQPLNKPIVGMWSTPLGDGYWQVATDGGIFTFGSAVFLGSMGGQPLNEPVVGGAPAQTTPSPCTAAPNCPTVGLTTFSANPSPYGQPITMLSTLRDAADVVTPTGPLTLIDVNDGATICTLPLAPIPGRLATSGITCTFTPPPSNGVGQTIFIRGVYPGDATFAPNTGLAQVVEAGTAVTSISVTASPNSVPVGSTTTLQAKLTGNPPPTGNLTFLADNIPIAGCGRIVGQSGVAQSKCNYTPNSVGPHTITVTYSGDINYAAAGPSSPIIVTAT